MFYSTKSGISGECYGGRAKQQNRKPLCIRICSNPNCLVTGQPDWAMVVIRYRGQPIDHAGLLRYIVSFCKSQRIS